MKTNLNPGFQQSLEKMLDYLSAERDHFVIESELDDNFGKLQKHIYVQMLFVMAFMYGRVEVDPEIAKVVADYNLFPLRVYTASEEIGPTWNLMTADYEDWFSVNPSDDPQFYTSYKYEIWMHDFEDYFNGALPENY